MITVPTHKRHKSPFKHSKTIYIFTSRPVIVTVQIHSRKKDFEGVKNDHCKMDISTGAQQEFLRYPAARFNEKGCLQACSGAAFRASLMQFQLVKLY
jgi:hypothetical protein